MRSISSCFRLVYQQLLKWKISAQSKEIVPRRKFWEDYWNWWRESKWMFHNVWTFSQWAKLNKCIRKLFIFSFVGFLLFCYGNPINFKHVWIEGLKERSETSFIYLVQNGSRKELLILFRVEKWQRLSLSPGDSRKIESIREAHELFAYFLNELFQLHMRDCRRNCAYHWQAWNCGIKTFKS